MIQKKKNLIEPPVSPRFVPMFNGNRLPLSLVFDVIFIVDVVLTENM